ncbi:PD40 domain-containing protein [Carboxylicivirga sediminis]|uniref:PD40 domain-containing protein n=1 Tax=Carboxylicivirga sediminis TaxID=2006564 RepID=A0A941IWP6_9BACT|nr:PD40 domain-containing protein [Carboxylicivirga sediminis]MBR8535966.1 PD40 domain-containing protein [Carboxylicivirga sediminis]
MIKNFLIIILCAIVVPAIASDKKPRKKDLVPIENLMQVDNYEKAAAQIKQLQKKHPDNPYLYLINGICLLNIDGRIKEAIHPLQLAKAHYGIYSNKNDNALKANYHLGQAYHLTYKFKEALALFEILQDSVPVNRSNIHAQLKQQINFCKNAIELEKQPVEFRITNLGQAINTEYDEHSPIISGDENLLMFTSNRKGLSKKIKDEALFPEDIYSTKWRDGQWLPSVNAGISINTNKYDATCSLSSDGQSLIIYRNEGNGNLYISQQSNNKWSEPQKLPKPINSAYEESHASLSLDGNSIVFTSTRPGGLGGKDIYISHKLPTGDWGKASLLSSAVNTPLNEESPFLSYDGQTLFFASEGHTSMGGYDIFKSEKDSSGNWGKAVNIGYPINTPGDDLFYIPTLDGQRVYFASERNEGYGRSDIYIIEFPETDERSLAVVSGYLFTENGQPSSESVITVTKALSDEEQGIFRPQTNTGKYTMILPTGIEYIMTIETPGMITISKELKLPYRTNYKTRTGATYLEPMVLKK